jgi:uncharacterized protein (TIGR02598 family)
LCRSALLGFTLVEVTIAVGIVSFAVISILGLLPTGLSTLRSAMNQTVEAQIVRTIGAQSVVTAFASLATNNVYFDQDGLPTTSSDEARYTVNVEANAPVFPGSANAGTLTNSLTSLKIQIVARPSPQANGTTNFYSLQVANAGK